MDAAALAVEFIQVLGSFHNSGIAGRFGGVVFFLFFVFFLEVGIVPDRLAEQGFSDGAGIEDHLVMIGLELGAAKIGAGGLQGIEKKPGGFAVDLAGDDKAHDLRERDLDALGVFENRKIDRDLARTSGACAIGVELDALLVMQLVKVAEAVAAQGGRSALRAVDLKCADSGMGMIAYLTPVFRGFKVSSFEFPSFKVSMRQSGLQSLPPDWFETLKH